MINHGLYCIGDQKGLLDMANLLPIMDIGTVDASIPNKTEENYRITTATVNGRADHTDRVDRTM